MKKFFVNLSIKIFNYIYYLQNKKHEKRMEKLKSHVLSGSICDEKYHTTSSATLTIKNNSKEEKRANRQKIENIINKCLDKPEKFFEYIQGAKTPVYKIKKAIINLANLKSIDESGINAMLRLKCTMRKNKGIILICHVPEYLSEALKSLKLKVVPNEKSALNLI